MLEGLNSAAAGMAAQQQRIDAVANDLANANTTGYKQRARRLPRPRLHADGPRVRPGPADRRRRRRGRRRPRLLAGRRCSAPTSRSTSRSRATGFLRVRLADGTQALTRDGSLQLDGDGRLVTSSGAFVQPADHRPRRHGPEPITIGPDGTCSPAAGASAASSSSPSARRRRCGPSATTPSSPRRSRAPPRRAPAAHDAHAGRARGLQRRHVRGDGRDDRVPARVPAHVQGDPDRRTRCGRSPTGSSADAALRAPADRPTRALPARRPRRARRTTRRPTRPRSASSSCCSASSSRR